MTGVHLCVCPLSCHQLWPRGLCLLLAPGQLCLLFPSSRELSLGTRGTREAKPLATSHEPLATSQKEP